MRSSGYFTNPHLVLGAICVWDPGVEALSTERWTWTSKQVPLIDTQGESIGLIRELWVEEKLFSTCASFLKCENDAQISSVESYLLKTGQTRLVICSTFDAKKILFSFWKAVDKFWKVQGLKLFVVILVKCKL